jgi:hypothetical protein
LKNNKLPNYSTEQENLNPEDFYAQIYKLINPKGLDAKQAYEATLAALVEQLETRVQSVENGENYFLNNKTCGQKKIYLKWALLSIAESISNFLDNSAIKAVYHNSPKESIHCGSP